MPDLRWFLVLPDCELLGVIPRVRDLAGDVVGDGVSFVGLHMPVEGFGTPPLAVPRHFVRVVHRVADHVEEVLAELWPQSVASAECEHRCSRSVMDSWIHGFIHSFIHSFVRVVMFC